METWLETLLGLARDGKTIGLVPKNPLQLAVLVHEAGNWAYPTGIPMPIWKTLFAPVTLLAFVGRLLGHRACYPEYSRPEAAQTIQIEQNMRMGRPPDKEN